MRTTVSMEEASRVSQAVRGGVLRSRLGCLACMVVLALALLLSPWCTSARAEEETLGTITQEDAEVTTPCSWPCTCTNPSAGADIAIEPGFGSVEDPEQVAVGNHTTVYGIDDGDDDVCDGVESKDGIYQYACVASAADYFELYSITTDIYYYGSMCIVDTFDAYFWLTAKKPGRCDVRVIASDCGTPYDDPEDAEAIFRYCVTCIGPTGIGLDQDRIAPGERTEAHVTMPENRTVGWEIVEKDPPDLRVRLKENSVSAPPADQSPTYDVTIIADKDSPSGAARIRAYDAEFPDCFVEVVVHIGCGCSSCGSGGCKAGDGEAHDAGCHDLQPLRRVDCDDPIGGSLDTNDITGRGGINFSFNLGDLRDSPVGTQLRLKGRSPLERLVTPAGLYYPYTGGGTSDPYHVLYDSGLLRQIRLGDHLVNVKDVSATDDKFELEFYETTSRTLDPNNEYYDVSSLTPFVTWVIEAPDPNTYGYELIRLSKYDTTDPNNPVLLQRHIYLYDDTDLAWTRTQQDGSANDLLEVATDWGADPNDPNKMIRTVSVTRDGATTVQKEIYDHAAAGDPYRLIGTSVSTGTGWLDTDYAYYETGTYAGQLKWVVEPNGAWRWYTYADITGGYTETEFTGWLNESLSTSDPNTTANTTYTVRTYDGDHQLEEVVSYADGSIISKTTYDVSHTYDAGGAKLTTTEEVARYSDASHYLTTTTEYEYPDASRPEWRRVTAQDQPDGRTVTYTYEEGGYTSGTLTFDTQGSGYERTTILTTGADVTPTSIGTNDAAEETVYITDAGGHTVYSAHYVHYSGNWVPDRLETMTYDGRGRLTDRYERDPGDGSVLGHQQTDWLDCCKTRQVTDADGRVTTALYDDLGRPLGTVQWSVAALGSYAAQPYRVTYYTYGVASGYPTTTVLKGYATSMDPNDATDVASATFVLGTRTTYDLAGRVITKEDLDATGASPSVMRTTTYTHDIVSGGGNKVTVTDPDSETQITEYYRDGKTKSVTGTSVVPTYYTYGVGSDPLVTLTEVGSTSSDRYAETTVD